MVSVVYLCGKGMLNYYILEVWDDCAIFPKNVWDEVCPYATFELEDLN
jgi:hypothetical protein